MAKILLVEDDNNLREIFEMRLQAEGYQTIGADDGEEALVVATREKPDLIIADIMMPKLSGFEMLENLKAVPDMADTKVIMMTALGQAEDRTRGEKLGVVKYLVKSQVTLEDFVRVVREVLPADGANASTDAAGEVKSSVATNKLESERTMQNDNTNPNPAGSPPAGDSPPSSPGGDTPAPGMGDQPSTAEEQKAVDEQVNSFAAGGSSTTSASGDMPSSDPSPISGGTSAQDAPTPPSPDPTQPGDGSPQPPTDQPPEESGPAGPPPTPGN